MVNRKLKYKQGNALTFIKYCVSLFTKKRTLDSQHYKGNKPFNKIPNKNKDFEIINFSISVGKYISIKKERALSFSTYKVGQKQTWHLGYYHYCMHTDWKRKGTTIYYCPGEKKAIYRNTIPHIHWINAD